MKFKNKVILVIFFLGHKFLLCTSPEYTCQSLPSQIISYLKTKEVSKDIKNILDEIFRDNKIQQAFLQTPYCIDYVNNNYNEAGKLLKEKGFTPLLRGFFQICKHEKLPNYVLKFPRSQQFKWQLNHAGRIRYAELLQETINTYKLPLKIPQKWAYFISNSNQIIVVSEYVNINNSQELTLQQLDAIKKLEQIAKYPDFTKENIVNINDIGIILDTEPLGIVLSYP